MLKTLLKYLLYLCAFVTVVMLLPGSVLLDVKPKAFLHHLPKAFEGPFKPNERLSQTTKLFNDEIFGPESLAVFDGKLVTGAADGYLYQLDGTSPKPLLKIVEKSCFENPYNTTKCGRPLGLKFDSKGVLYVVEPSVGVFSVKNIFTNNPKVELVMDIDETQVLGQSSKFLDDLTIDEGAGLNGGHVLYLSDVSVKFDLFECILSVLGTDLGRIVKYDVNAKRVESVAENILFPNGMEISDDRNAILYNEFVARRVIKLYIKGPKKGESEVLMKELPGEPDNIRRSASKKETYWVGLFSARTAAKPNELDYYLRKPLLRKLYCRLLHLFGSAIHFVGNLFTNTMIT
jgi:hypothetical protein